MRYAIPLALAGAVACMSGCGAATRPVSFRVIDMGGNAPVAHARLRACPLSTNSQPLPITLEHLCEAKEALKISASTDERGLATLRLYRNLPSLIEVLPWSPDFPTEGAPVEWVYDPSDRSLTPTHHAIGGDAVRPSVRLELAGR